MSRLRLATLLALPALAYACANSNGEGPGSGRGGANGSGSGGQGGSSAAGGNSAPGGSSGVAGTTGQAPGGMGGDTGGGGSGAGDGTGGDRAGGGAAGTAGVDPRCPTAAPVGGLSCRIPDDAGAFCLYGTMMCVCGATGQTTGMWQCFGGGGAGGGDVTGTGGGGGGTTGAAGTTGAGRGGAGGAAPATPCPASLPSGGSCTPEGKICSYGTAPRPECRDRATCTGGKWVAATAACPAPLSTGCPATAPEAGQTVSCTGAMVDGYCRYTAGNGVECRCVGNATTGGVFVCNRPTAPPAPCPAMLPNAGTACGTATQSCAYPCAGQLSSVAVTASCSGGTWSWVQSGCVAP